MRAGHDDALVDVEGQAGEPCFLKQVGDGKLLAHAALGEGLDAPLLCRREAGRKIGVERQPERPQREPGGFVVRVIGPVAVVERCRGEAAFDAPDQLGERQGSSWRRTSR